MINKAPPILLLRITRPPLQRSWRGTVPLVHFFVPCTILARPRPPAYQTLRLQRETPSVPFAILYICLPLSSCPLTLLKCQFVAFSTIVIVERFDRHPGLAIVHQRTALAITLIPVLLLVKGILGRFAVSIAIPIRKQNNKKKQKSYNDDFAFIN